MLIDIHTHVAGNYGIVDSIKNMDTKFGGILKQD